MCTPGGGGRSDAVAQQQMQEQQREARIKAGSAAISNAFDAGRANAYTDLAMLQLEDQHADAPQIGTLAWPPGWIG
jgi:hypothetical protein